MGDLQWMVPPLAMCLVLTGIHGYLGIHVLSRKVIFVDLALAQIAALGSTTAWRCCSVTTRSTVTPPPCTCSRSGSHSWGLRSSH